MEIEKMPCPKCGHDLSEHFEVLLRYAGPSDEGFNIEMSSPMFKLYACAIADVFDRAGAVNFYTIAMYHKNRQFEITIRQMDGSTPAQLLTEKDNELDRLKQENERLNDIANTFKVSESSSIKYKDEQIIKLQQNQAKLIEALDLLKNGLRQAINCHWLKKQPLFGIHHCSGCTFGLICPDSLVKEVCGGR